MRYPVSHLPGGPQTILSRLKCLVCLLLHCFSGKTRITGIFCCLVLLVIGFTSLFFKSVPKSLLLLKKTTWFIWKNPLHNDLTPFSWRSFIRNLTSLFPKDKLPVASEGQPRPRINLDSTLNFGWEIWHFLATENSRLVCSEVKSICLNGKNNTVTKVHL